MVSSQRFWSNLYSVFWSLYGRYAWDDQREPSRVSEPPECIVDVVQSRRCQPDEWVLDAGCGTGNYAIVLADPAFTLGELHRVLKPGGTLVLSLPKHDATLFSQPVGELIRYRIRHLERRTPSKMLLVVLKSFGDRFSNRPRWTRPQAQQMVTASGFRVVSLDEGRQILVVTEKTAPTAGTMPQTPVNAQYPPRACCSMRSKTS